MIGPSPQVGGLVEIVRRSGCFWVSHPNSRSAARPAARRFMVDLPCLGGLPWQSACLCVFEELALAGRAVSGARARTVRAIRKEEEGYRTAVAGAGVATATR